MISFLLLGIACILIHAAIVAAINHFEGRGND